MKKYNKAIIYSVFFSIICLLNFGWALNIQAAASQDLTSQMNTVGQTGWGASNAVTPTSMVSMIQTAVSAFLGLLGIIFLILIIYAGFLWMTAQGEEEKVTKAKDTITRAVIGLVIIVLAYAITYFVFSSLPGGDESGSSSASNIIGTND